MRSHALRRGRASAPSWWLAGALLLTVPLAAAQPLPRLFEGGWMGFDTGRFPDPDPSGFAPDALAVGDLDGDGVLDLVVGQAHAAGAGVSVLRGLGGGTFDRPVFAALPLNDSVGRVALVDVDADLDLDVVATVPNAWHLGTDVALWRNDGTGALGVPERFGVGVDPLGIATGDLTGDGRPDVVTADSGAGTISLLEHDGGTGPAAGFRPARTIGVGGVPQHVLAADVSGDGALDLVVSRMDAFNPVVTVLLGDGAGGFAPGRDTATDPGGPGAIALGDADRDGDLDLAIAGQQDAGRDAVRILGNDGTGTFGAWVENVTTGTPRCAALALADLNGDLHLDVVALGPNGRSQESWSAMLSDGAGRHHPGTPYPSSQNSGAIAAFDADGDGDAEVVTLARFSSAVNVWTNPGTGIFELPPRHPVDGAPLDVDAADLDGDGDLDVVSACSTMQVHWNRGDGTFTPAETIPTPPGLARIEWIKLRDVTGDGVPDLLMSPGGNGKFAVARNLGDGTLLPADVWPSDSCGGGPIDAFDLDADGDRDIVLVSCGDAFGEYLLVSANDGTGGFSNRPHVPCQIGGNSVEAADVDGDTILDLIVNESGLGLATFHGNGNLTFGPDVLSLDPPPLLARIGDFDANGVMDAAVVIGQGSAGTDWVGIARGRGDGTFENPVLQSGSSTIEPLRLTSDLDVGRVACDETLDVVATYYASNDLGLFEGLGDATLRPQVRYGAALVPVVSVVGDFTGDGVKDVAMLAQPVTPCCSPALLVLPGRCPCPGANPNPVAPGEVQDLRVARQASALNFTWRPPAPGAASYRVVSGTIGTWYDHRADDARGLGACSVPASPWTDADDAALDGVDRYYLVLGVEGCADVIGRAGFAWNGRDYLPRPAPLATPSCP